MLSSGSPHLQRRIRITSYTKFSPKPACPRVSSSSCQAHHPKSLRKQSRTASLLHYTSREARPFSRSYGRISPQTLIIIGAIPALSARLVGLLPPRVLGEHLIDQVIPRQAGKISMSSTSRRKSEMPFCSRSAPRSNTRVRSALPSHDFTFRRRRGKADLGTNSSRRRRRLGLGLRRTLVTSWAQ
jgi:hypothetical protein